MKIPTLEDRPQCPVYLSCSCVCCVPSRFRCIVYPLRPKPTVLVAKGAIMFIWFLAMAIMCPAAVALTVERVPFHDMVHSDDLNHTYPLYTCYEKFVNPQMTKVYTAVLFAHIYLAPLMLITLMYGSIGIKLGSSLVANREQRLADAAVRVRGRGRRGAQPMILQRRIKVIKMLILVALLFMLSWLPLWTLMMMTDHAGLERDQLDLLTSYIFPFAHWLAFSNSSVNPIIYGYYNENFRRGFQVVCKSRTFCCSVQSFWRRWMTSWAREGGSATNNHNQLTLGPRNRVHHDNRLTAPAELSTSGRKRRVAVQSHRGSSNQGLELVAMDADQPGRRTASYQAWNN